MEQFPDLNSIGKTNLPNQPIANPALNKPAEEQLDFSGVNSSNNLAQANEVEEELSEKELASAYKEVYNNNPVFKENFKSAKELRQALNDMYNLNAESYKSKNINSAEEYLYCWLSGAKVPPPTDPRFFKAMGNNQFLASNGQTFTFNQQGQLVNVNDLANENQVTLNDAPEEPAPVQEPEQQPEEPAPQTQEEPVVYEEYIGEPIVLKYAPPEDPVEPIIVKYAPPEDPVIPEEPPVPKYAPPPEDPVIPEEPPVLKYAPPPEDPVIPEEPPVLKYAPPEDPVIPEEPPVPKYAPPPEDPIVPEEPILKYAPPPEEPIPEPIIDDPGPPLKYAAPEVPDEPIEEDPPIDEKYAPPEPEEDEFE